MLLRVHGEDLPALVARVDALPRQGRTNVGIVGPPGARKSTLAGALTQRLAGRAVVVPQDGFHLADTELARQREWPAVRAEPDEVWYVDTDPALRAGRLVARHVGFGKSAAEAARWAGGATIRTLGSSKRHAAMPTCWSTSPSGMLRRRAPCSPGG